MATISLRQYEYFVAVADELHFRRAANRLAVAQPALSAQISAIEEQLGAKLFHRNNRRVELSTVGELLLPEARAVLRQADRALHLAKRAGRGEFGALDIACVGSAALGGALSDIIHRYRTRAPDVRLQFLEMDMDKQIEALILDRLDVGFIRTPVPEDYSGRIGTVPVQRELLMLALRFDHPLSAAETISLSQLRNEDFILTHLEPTMGFAACVHHLCASAGFVPRVAHRARQFSIIVNLVGAGLGVALVPESLQRFALPNIVYRHLDTEPVYTEVALAYATASISPPLELLLDLVAADEVATFPQSS